MNTTTTKIVLLGSGYTSTWTYKYFMRYAGSLVKSGAVEIHVISDVGYHTFHGFSGEFLTENLPRTFYHNPVSKTMPLAKFTKGKVTQIDQLNNTVTFDAGGQSQKMPFDHLVIGIGSIDHQSLIEGVKKHAFSVKAFGQLAQCHQKINRAIRLARMADNDQEKRRLLSFAVLGGGYAAVELCTNLADKLQQLALTDKDIAEFATVKLVHADQGIMPQMQPKLKAMRQYINRCIKDLNIEILANCPVQRVDENGLHLADGRFIRANTLVYAIGQKKYPPQSTRAFATTKDQAIVANKKLQVAGYQNIWVGGDIASVQVPFTSSTCKNDALWAIKHGTKIGKNLARAVKGKRLKNFVFPGLGQTLGLGRRNAVLELYGLQFHGRLAWLLRAGFFFYYYPDYNRVPVLASALFGWKRTRSFAERRAMVKRAAAA